MAQEVLTHLKEHPDAWTRVDTILEFSQNMNTKVSLATQVEEGPFLYFEEVLSDLSGRMFHSRPGQKTLVWDL